jgi:hypothetical protein
MFMQAKSTTVLILVGAVSLGPRRWPDRFGPGGPFLVAIIVSSFARISGAIWGANGANRG